MTETERPEWAPESSRSYDKADILDIPGSRLLATVQQRIREMVKQAKAEGDTKVLKELPLGRQLARLLHNDPAQIYEWHAEYDKSRSETEEATDTAMVRTVRIPIDGVEGASLVVSILSDTNLQHDAATGTYTQHEFPDRTMGMVIERLDLPQEGRLAALEKARNQLLAIEKLVSTELGMGLPLAEYIQLQITLETPQQTPLKTI